MKFTYQFQKWDGPNSRYVCPKCSKKTLVRFVDANKNHVGGETYGVCDRKEKCGYSMFPSKGELAGVDEVLKPIVKLETDYIKGTEMVGFVGDCNLKSFLRGEFSDAVVDEVFDKYHVLATDTKWEKSTVYYQIDNLDRVHTGKLMNYGLDGKRVKKPYNRIYWIHKLVERDFNMVQCLFGAHLIDDDLKREYAIVESEKTALICSMQYPHITWLATGGLHGLTREKMHPLEERIVYAYPDKGAYDKWSELFSPYAVKVSSILEIETTIEDGDDLGDYIIKARG